MKQLLIKLFIPHIFIQSSNGKFTILERAFLYMVFACAVLTYGVIYHYNSWGIFPFAIPFLIGIYVFLFFKIKDVNLLSDYWRTQLRLLSDPKWKNGERTDYELRLRERLNEKWYSEYGFYYSEIEIAKINKFVPILLPIICAIVLWLYA